MRPNKVTISDLFSQQRRYVIPLFQRGYVWEQELNWAPLWLDVVTQAERLAQAGEKSTRGIRKHFLGAVVLVAGEPRIRHVTDHGVIDGQQRLTTLQIMLVALRDIVSPLGSNDLLRELRALTLNEGQWSSSDEAYKVWPTVAGREDFRNIVTAGGRSKLELIYPTLRRRRKLLPRPRLVEAYLFFSEQITSYLRGASIQIEEDGTPVLSEETNPTGGAVDPERAWLLLEALKTYVHLVTIELEPEDDPQVIFETLNARMVPLTPADLVRNFVFMEAMRQEQDLDVLYEQVWSEFEVGPTSATDAKPFWKGDTKQGRRYYSRMDLLCFHYVTMRSGAEVAQKHLFQAFRDWWHNGDQTSSGLRPPGPEGRDATQEVMRLRKAAHDLRSYLVPPNSAETVRDRFAQRLHALDLTTPFPLLLYLDEHRTKLSEEEYHGMLSDLEGYLVRRAVLGLTIKNYNRVFIDLLARVRAGGPEPSRIVLQAALEEFTGESGVWPSDDDFKIRFAASPIYVTLGPIRTQMILRALERTYRTGKEENLPIPHLTVEHILPQTADPKVWPLPTGGGTASPEQATMRNTVCHSIGNLTLLTQALNSNLSNGTFRNKRPAIAEQSQLRMNVFFQRYERDTWFEGDIVARGMDLAERALRIWPRPASSQGGTMSAG